MPATEAQILANQANSARSTGPTSDQGRCRSRANSLKHGLTGAGIVLPEEDAAEVERLSVAFQAELNAEGEVGKMLARRMATMAVRMDRCADLETASLTERVRRVLGEFVPPEGVDAFEAERLRDEAARRAMFDSSKDSCLARKYEAAAERGFFKALKELRQLNEQAKATSPVAEMVAQAKTSLAELGSFLPAAPKPALPPSKPVPSPTKASLNAWDPFAPTHFDVPISIGKRR
jgi:hypothetical protein